MNVEWLMMGVSLGLLLIASVLMKRCMDEDPGRYRGGCTDEAADARASVLMECG